MPRTRRGKYSESPLIIPAMLGAAAVADSACAHGFGQRYDLPGPLWLYLTGAAAAVGVSFLLLALFLRATQRPHSYPRLNLLRFHVGRAFAHPYLLSCVRLLALAMFVLVVVAGFIGAQNPFKNIAPIMVWAIWWVGVAYVSALLGNIWALLNPVDTAFAIVEHAYSRLRGAALSRGLRYPDWLGIWPAAALFLAFAWAELVWEHGDAPASVAAAVLAYCAIAWLGMFLFGREVWLKEGETFSIVFRLLARFSPTEVRVRDAKVCAGCPTRSCRGPSGCVDCYACFRRAPRTSREWNLRPYAVGLLSDAPVHSSLMALVMLMLATVTFDGFIETPAWAYAVDRVTAWLSGASLLSNSGDVRAIVYTSGLVAFVVAFFLIYLGFCLVVAKLTAASPESAQRGHGSYGAVTIARCFVLTLLPIAIAYHLAHYLSFLLMAGQYLIPLASDPFGFGWDLFGTSRYFVRIAIVDARFVWYTSVVAIVTGHIAAVYLAHMTALRIFRDKRTAMLSQYPMLALMIGYTMVSLWIIAQPIVSSRFG